MFAPAKILVPTDFSEYSDKALAQALDIAKQHHAKVYLLHVIHEEIHRCWMDYCLADEQMEEFANRLIGESNENLKKQVAKFPEAAVVELAWEVKNGLPYDVILKEEQKKGIDLIVIASLGRSGIVEFFMGSTARNVLKGAKGPVLLVK